MIQQLSAIRDGFKYYRKENPSDKSIKLETYVHIVSGFLFFILNKVLDGAEVRLSGGRSLGSIYVRGKKKVPKFDDSGNIKGLAPNWSATNRLWESNPSAKERGEKIYYTNDHTNGVAYTFCWNNSGMVIANKNLYSLVFTRGENGNRKKLSNKIMEGKEYLITEHKEPINYGYKNGDEEVREESKNDWD